VPNRTGERGREKKKKRTRNRKKNQTTSCYTCKNKTRRSTASVGHSALAPAGAPESRQAEKNKHTNKQKQAQVAEIAYNTTVNIDDLKPQDNTSTA